MVGLLAEIFLNKENGATIVHDSRVIWNVEDTVDNCKGQLVASRSGHAYVKAAMRKTGAIYGGELSAHHYFRDFSFCDSGMIPWLMVWELLSEQNTTLAHLVEKRQSLFISSEEINFTVSDADSTLGGSKKPLLKIGN